MISPTAPVQQDKTKETMIEIRKELTDIADKRPATNEELKEGSKQLDTSAPGRWKLLVLLLALLVI